MVYKKHVRLEADGPRAAWAQLATWWGPAVIAAVTLAVFVPVANMQDSARCTSFVPEAVMNECDLSGQNAAGKDMHGSEIKDANAQRINLSGTNLTDATFTRSDLSGANLAGADLTGASLYEADVSGADLTGAILTRADLTGADLSGTTGLTNEMLASVAEWHGVVLQDRADIAAALSAVCQGVAIPEAAYYQSGQQIFHPFVLLTDQGEWHETSLRVKGWWPAAVQYAELVGCMGSEIQDTGYCSYNNGVSIEYTHFGLPIRLVSARTGMTVGSLTIWGDDRTCPPMTYGKGGDTRKVDRDHPDMYDFKDALEPYVHPDAEGTRPTVDSVP
ncbi:MAG: pentapeptide repeat-containing protein [Anaerolineae bacterium]|nr:pentapeptide repeat-containing protein [Anaerolineae bacterium]